MYVSRVPRTGGVILSPIPENWDTFFAALAEAEVPDDFLADRNQEMHCRDPFEACQA